MRTYAHLAILLIPFTCTAQVREDSTRSNPFPNAYTLTGSGFGQPRGTLTFQNVAVVYSNVSYSFTDWLSAGVGVSPFRLSDASGNLVSANAKIFKKWYDVLTSAAEVKYILSPEESSKIVQNDFDSYSYYASVWVLSGHITYGTPNNNLTLGISYINSTGGNSQFTTDFDKAMALTFATSLRTFSFLSLLGEVTVKPKGTTDNGQVIITPGFRFHGRRWAIDASAIVTGGYDYEQDPNNDTEPVIDPLLMVLPYISFRYRWSTRRGVSRS